MEKSVGPLSDDCIATMADFLLSPDAAARVTAAQQAMAMQQAAKLEAPVAQIKASALFFGRTAFAGGGIACAACHQADGKGGSLATSLEYASACDKAGSRPSGGISQGGLGKPKAERPPTHVHYRARGRYRFDSGNGHAQWTQIKCRHTGAHGGASTPTPRHGQREGLVMGWIQDIFEPEQRSWEDFYRNRWAHDKVVRTTHGVNCTGSCSWNVYVKQGIVTWEMQALDYPTIDPTIPNYEPRGCQRGISTSRGTSTARCA
jgi:hypothetical protein